MGKFITYIAIMSTMLLLFHLGGLVNETPNSTLLKLLLNPEDLNDGSTGSFWSKVILITEGVALTAAIVVGFITGQTELVILSSITIYLVNLLWDFIRVYAVLYSSSAVVAVIFFGVFLITFLITAVDFWRGRD